MATQYRIAKLRVLAQWDRDAQQFVAVTKNGEAVWAHGPTEQQAVDALADKLYGTELSPDAVNTLEQYFSGHITVVNCGEVDDDEEYNPAQGSHQRDAIRQPAPNARWGRKGGK